MEGRDERLLLILPKQGAGLEVRLVADQCRRILARIGAFCLRLMFSSLRGVGRVQQPVVTNSRSVQWGLSILQLLLPLPRTARGGVFLLCIPRS